MAWGNRADRIEHEGPRFVWQQIADDIAADIRSGALPANSRLPAEQDLAADVYGVARATVRRAVAHLVEKGLVVVMHGRGTYVAPNDGD
jgi:DNA-binding GntR family transcriptional regulator